MTMKVVADGAVVDYESRLILIAVDDPPAFEEELQAVRAGN